MTGTVGKEPLHERCSYRFPPRMRGEWSRQTSGRGQAKCFSAPARIDIFERKKLFGAAARLRRQKELHHLAVVFDCADREPVHERGIGSVAPARRHETAAVELYRAFAGRILAGVVALFTHHLRRTAVY